MHETLRMYIHDMGNVSDSFEKVNIFFLHDEGKCQTYTL